MQLQPKRKVEACAVAAPAVIIELPYTQESHTLLEDSNLVYPISTIAVVYYEQTEDQKAHMTQHKTVASKDSEYLDKYWQNDANIFGFYSDHRSRFIVMLTQLSSMWDGGMVILVELATSSRESSYYHSQTPSD